MGKFSKDKRDIYYRLSKELGWRARSIWKLYAIDEHLHLLQNCKRAVDLCAAPGGWSQLLAVRLLKNISASNASSSTSLGNDEHENEDEIKECGIHNHSEVSIIAVDLAAMLPIHGVRILQADITHFQTAPNIIHELGENYADIVLCDGAPDVIGVQDIDESIQLELLCAALQLSVNILEEGGSFVGKIFRGPQSHRILALMHRYFKNVLIAKPRASRNSSVEAFVVGQQFNISGPRENVILALWEVTDEEAEKAAENTEFLACDTPLSVDSDASYPLTFNISEELAEQLTCPPPYRDTLAEDDSKSEKSQGESGSSASLKSAKEYTYTKPTAMPIAPAYATSIHLLKHSGKNR